MNLWAILTPFEWLVSWVMFIAHNILGFLGIQGGDAGPAWIISIVLMTVFIRLCMVPLFIKQIKSMRKMQTLQPKMKLIQAKYKGKKDSVSQQAQQKEIQALYSEEGVNPMASCLPMLIQSPFFFSLYRVLNSVQKIATGEQDPIGPLDQAHAADFEATHFFGARLSDSFTSASSGVTHWVIGGMVACMCLTMFYSQWTMTHKNTPIETKDTPQFKTQKMMMYIFPAMYIFSGGIFQVGVLVYMLTTNLWTLAQQTVQLHYMPTPGSEAYKKFEVRVAEKRKADIASGKIVVEEPEKAQRAQPVGKKRAKAGGKPGAKSTTKKTPSKSTKPGNGTKNKDK